MSLTPRRELRALALPSEIMRLPNLEGYLKFPGPFPVASIRLRYVARQKAAERFVPREGDGGVTEASELAPAAPAEDDGMTVPPLPGEAGVESGESPTAPEDAQDTVAHQGELDLVPLPGEAGPATAANGGAPEGDAGGAVPAAEVGGPVPDDGPSVTEAKPPVPRAGNAASDDEAGSVPDGDRPSDWG